jgi:GH43 family beta-xylosidase
MWVLQSEGDDPQGRYRLCGGLDTDGWAIDGTILKDNDKLYYIWSGWPGRENGQQNLYIAPMSDPMTLAGPRQLLAVPDQPWECIEMAICEGPQVLQRNGLTFIVYSASGSWCSDYCLGLLVNRSGDILNHQAWQKIGPVFQKTDEVWGIGHCSFIKSLCGTEDWILYHSKSKKKKGWTDRDVHIQPFHWHPDGLPNFGRPTARGVLLPKSQEVSSLSRAA